MVATIYRNAKHRFYYVQVAMQLKYTEHHNM